MQTTNPREAAYDALMRSRRHEAFIADTLLEWKRSSHPKNEDFRLAQEIAYGTMRMQRVLDHLAAQLGKVAGMKLKEKALLRMALYQHHFLSSIPLYAIVNETVSLGKKTCHPTFVKFLNAVLRSLEKKTLTVPTEPLGLAYSYPDSFVEDLIADYGEEEAVKILQAGNTPTGTCARVRGKTLQFVDVNDVESAGNDPAVYIQNKTPATLLWGMAEHITSSPGKILDLCASPGGKTIALHDLFPEAAIYANDVSEEKLATLRSNLSKYQIEAVLTCSLGEELRTDERFDLIIIDAPCSNTGVLNKRAEARWRLSKENTEALVVLQQKLLSHAATLLAPGGAIGFMTCSISKEENERNIERFCREKGLTCLHQQTILPTTDCRDGGYCGLITPQGV